MSPPKLTSLLTLLDDHDEIVRDGVQTALMDYQGDLSDTLASEGIFLSNTEAEELSRRLHPGRQAALRSEWVVPFDRLNSPDGDWEALESLLRLVSDYLHDGVSLRPSLSDQLDILAEELSEKVNSPIQLANYLFKSGQISGNRLHPFDVRNSDLAWCLLEAQSNPLGLSLIYMLIAQRLDMQVYGCNYPGHFLCLIDHNGAATLVDCFHGARLTPVNELLSKHPDISKEARAAVRQPCTLTAMLRRTLANMHLAFEKGGRIEDTNLMYELLVPFGYD